MVAEMTEQDPMCVLIALCCNSADLAESYSLLLNSMSGIAGELRERHSRTLNALRMRHCLAMSSLMDGSEQELPKHVAQLVEEQRCEVSKLESLHESEVAELRNQQSGTFLEVLINDFSRLALTAKLPKRIPHTRGTRTDVGEVPDFLSDFKTLRCRVFSRGKGTGGLPILKVALLEVRISLSDVVKRIIVEKQCTSPESLINPGPLTGIILGGLVNEGGESSTGLDAFLRDVIDCRSWDLMSETYAEQRADDKQKTGTSPDSAMSWTCHSDLENGIRAVFRVSCLDASRVGASLCDVADRCNKSGVERLLVPYPLIEHLGASSGCNAGGEPELSITKIFDDVCQLAKCMTQLAKCVTSNADAPHGDSLRELYILTSRSLD